ncbi:hypothetical protein, variant [Cladophialophora immunda]|uniref:Uncharacterized protein n=1 Tax=Cladophialophora immunda TaxID=569365 RepID=A0A0D2BRW2_9EURO|nr:uncharacterized protein PV07_12772 [Cladophialophora immunda]XP_016242019.1 hypothetical protein, variant [Cladophialophora immunda]KIW21802.1 hypothetical protein PV07_12772 [Cladophialophora immunda]KIW21803.1 hypothetical protein, variant [Cladophialophora immunda]
MCPASCMFFSRHRRETQHIPDQSPCRAYPHFTTGFRNGSSLERSASMVGRLDCSRTRQRFRVLITADSTTSPPIPVSGIWDLDVGVRNGLDALSIVLDMGAGATATTLAGISSVGYSTPRKYQTFMVQSYSAQIEYDMNALGCWGAGATLQI